MEILSDDVQGELEALTVTYDSAAVSAAPPPRVTLPLVPRHSPDEHHVYVAATLTLSLGSEYPIAPPEVAVTDVRGMSDGCAASMLASLRSEAAEMAGELVLGHLCETALDLLTERNAPEGDCIFCLQPLLAAAGAAAATSADVVKLGCFHCFHGRCFRAWFRWQQAQQQEREAQVRAEYKSMAEGRLKEEDIRTEDVPGVKAGRLYVVRCPSCRADVPPGALPPPVLADFAAGGRASLNQAEGWAAGAHAGVECLDEGARRRVAEAQRRFAQVLAAQRRCGGLVEENVAVSLAELQQAADDGRAAQAPGGAAPAPSAANGAKTAAAAPVDPGKGRSGQAPAVQQPGDGAGRGHRGRGGRRQRPGRGPGAGGRGPGGGGGGGRHKPRPP